MARGTFGDLVTNITTETRSSVSAPEIKRKIMEAIESYRHHSFYFNQKSSSVGLLSGVRDYPMDGVAGHAPADIIRIELMTILHGSRPIDMMPVDPLKILTDSLITTTGLPAYWSQYGNSLLFYPTPNSAYTVNIHYVADVLGVSEASNNSAFDFWTRDAERLIRNYAKALIFGELLRNEAEQNRALELASRAYLDLKSKSSLRQSGFPIEPWEIGE